MDEIKAVEDVIKNAEDVLARASSGWSRDVTRLTEALSALLALAKAQRDELARLESLTNEADVEAVARVIHKVRQERGFGGSALWEYEPVQIQELHRQVARAALTAFLARKGKAQ